jgi:positive phototaxis protein PixI
MTDTLPPVTIAPPPSQFLSFDINAGLRGMLAAELVREVVNWDVQQIVPIFDAPEAVMGVGSYRGDVLWLVDLPCLLGVTPLYHQAGRQHYSIIVLKQKEKMVGLAVAQVGQLLSFETAQIQLEPLPHLPYKLALCLRGAYQASKQSEFLILEPAKLFDLLTA